MKYIELALILIFLTACTTQQVAPPVEEKTPVQEACPQGKGWCYTQLTKDILSRDGQELLSASPKDYAAFCGVKAKLDCYADLIKAMSYFESGWDKDQVYVESFTDAKGQRVRSVGLLQESIESCKAYGASANTTEELMQVGKNLECGVRIMNRWIPKDGVIAGGSKGAWKGNARYWSVLRTKVAQIQARMK